MTMNCFDCPDPAAVAAKAKALASNGIKRVILYINPGWLADAKTVKLAHIEALHTAGIGVAFVCEQWGGSDNFKHGDITAATGAHHGKVCSDYMKQLGAPAGVMCAPTVDNDVNTSQIKNLCLPYAVEFRNALDPDYAFGFYSAGALLFALENVKPGILTYPWLSNAGGWSRSHEYAATGRAAITQQRDTKFLGLDIDPNVLLPAAEAAFWMPANTVVDLNT